MPGSFSRRRTALLGSSLFLGITLAVVACTDTVYKDRPPFNPPPDGETSGFLGYFTPADQQTTCGNCHVGQQADWIQTGHHQAWNDLQASPDNNATC
ncbi:MAG TPA: hypothetical protein VLB12_04070, partial [Gemmatimonadales bacterium]|nr:hypothetical protein [Gemmatimonadales bacterium]